MSFWYMISDFLLSWLRPSCSNPTLTLFDDETVEEDGTISIDESLE